MVHLPTLPFLKKKKKTPSSSPSANPSLNPQTALEKGLVSVQDVIAPAAIEVDFSHIKINNTYNRTLFVSGYPRFVSANWLSPLINFDHPLNISMFIYPVDGKTILDDLKRKVGEMEAEISSDIQRGKVVNPATQVKLDDALKLQQQLVKGAERFFQFGLYITLSAPTLEELDQTSKEIVSTLGSLLIVAKTAILQAEDGFKTTLPICVDRLQVNRNMDTTSLATTFPFTSSELTANQGIMYGINEHNESLIIFDRFTLENANMVVFAKSGAGKSYLVKLEALRSLMFDTEVLIIDPENEYQTLCEAIGGEYLNFSLSSPYKINPFDLGTIHTSSQTDVLSQKILSLHSFFKVVLGELSPQEDSLIDQAIVATYKMRGITPEPETHKNEPPLMEDLYKTIIGMESNVAMNLASKLEKFVKGSFRGIFDQQTSVNLKNTFTVFSIRDVEDELRPLVMFMVLDYIWNRIKGDTKKRLLIIDEAWYLMKYPDSASFVHSIAKRARKYYLGLTTITQDVEDFLSTDYGKAVVTNSSLQVLMKQSPTALQRLQEVFYLSEGEKHLLLAADVGEGLFFAGSNHVAMRVVASPDEHILVTSKPQEIIRLKTEKAGQPPPPAGTAKIKYTPPPNSPKSSPPLSGLNQPLTQPVSSLVQPRTSTPIQPKMSPSVSPSSPPITPSVPASQPPVTQPPQAKIPTSPSPSTPTTKTPTPISTPPTNQDITRF